VSRTLEAQLRTDVRKQGILVWLALDDHYGNFVDRLIQLRVDGELPYAVHGYHTSFPELLLALEPETSGGDRTPILVH
jgi:hypothetical protein